jgi:hypothetical protein
MDLACANRRWHGRAEHLDQRREKHRDPKQRRVVANA